jgi:hypothetical protein
MQICNYHGNTKSAKCKPFHVTCSIIEYSPAPSFTNIISRMLILVRKIANLKNCSGGVYKLFEIKIYPLKVSSDETRLLSCWIGLIVCSSLSLFSSKLRSCFLLLQYSTMAHISPSTTPVTSKIDRTKNKAAKIF